LEASHFTPTELREAALLAACLYEYEHVRPIIMSEEALRAMPGMREHLQAMGIQGVAKEFDRAMDEINRPPGQRPPR
jgi:hypothetical protein